MKFTTENKAMLLDFIIGLECISEEFDNKLETSYKKIETIEFYKIYTDIFTDINKHILDFEKVFISPFYPVLQSCYRKLYQKYEINNKEDFLKLFSAMSESEIRKVLKMHLEVAYMSDEEAIKHIKSMPVKGSIKFYLLEILQNPKEFKKNVKKVFELVYPIFEEHYQKAKILFEKKETELLQMEHEDIYQVANNFLGSEKLSTLQKQYNGADVLSLEDLEKDDNEIEVVPLLFGANRITIIGKGFDEDTSLRQHPTRKPIYCLGLDSIHHSEKMVEAEKVSKQVLKALSDDTRLDVLRMISFGLNTNKKLSKFFQVSPPAITYQTNTLKEAGLIATSDDGTMYVNTRNLDVALHKIEDLLSLKGVERK
ncbi:MAG: winged helix-turn-helix domain-containing protein [Gemella sp.]|nr:winged helix-turn-helix domain-containing protein [Gemella sp.]